MSLLEELVLIDVERLLLGVSLITWLYERAIARGDRIVGSDHAGRSHELTHFRFWGLCENVGVLFLLFQSNVLIHIVEEAGSSPRQ